jgi:hypothetical protein
MDVKAAYEKTRHFSNLDDFINAMQSRGKAAWPRAIIVCSPPAFRGSDKPNRDAELKLLKGLPGVGMLVGASCSPGHRLSTLTMRTEKPISTDEIAVRSRTSPREVALSQPAVGASGVRLYGEATRRRLDGVRCRKELPRDPRLKGALQLLPACAGHTASQTGSHRSQATSRSSKR